MPPEIPGDEFYVGYQPACPPRTALRVRLAVAIAAAIAVGLPLALVASQAAFAPAAFEYGVVRRFEGVVREAPVPVLAVPRPHAGGGDGFSQILLVAPGKHGARPDVAGLDGQRVRASGSLVYREGHTMLELAGPLEPLDDAPDAAAVAPAIAVEDLGEATLVGEIVDAKCHLGVMNPGDGKGHRGCAARCIAGGIPAILRARDPDGTVRRLLLVGDDGRSLAGEILDRVAEPVAVTGRVERQGDLLVLFAKPERIRRIAEG